MYRGTSWVLETDYPLGQKMEMAGGVWQREEEEEGSICSELSTAVQTWASDHWRLRKQFRR